MSAFFPFILCTWFIVCAFIREHVCVKNVTIKAEKLQVDFQSNVTLYCYFELEKDEVLLSVIWNRGTYEFYRYRPSYKTPMSTFAAYNINVDLNKSNLTHVTIRQVGYELDGNVTCEVTPDTSSSGKPFKMRSHTVTLQVISPPQERPTITTNKNKYTENDTLEANCTSSLSYPPSSLTFLLNNEPVGTPNNEKIRCGESRRGYPKIPCRTHDDRTTWTLLPLRLRLEKKHFVGDKINLKCTAIVENTNNRSTTEVTIPSSSNEPKPQQSTPSVDSNMRKIMDESDASSVQSSATTEQHILEHQIIIITIGTILWLSSK